MTKERITTTTAAINAALEAAISKGATAKAINNARKEAAEADALAKEKTENAKTKTEIWRATVTDADKDGDADAKKEAVKARKEAAEAKEAAEDKKAYAEAIEARKVTVGAGPIIVSYRRPSPYEAAYLAATEAENIMQAVTVAEAVAKEAEAIEAKTPAECRAARRAAARLAFLAPPEGVTKAEAAEAVAVAKKALRAPEAVKAKEAAEADAVYTYMDMPIDAARPTVALSVARRIAEAAAPVGYITAARYDVTRPEYIDAAAKVYAGAVVKSAALRQGTPLQWRLYTAARCGDWYAADLYDVYGAAVAALAIVPAKDAAKAEARKEADALAKAAGLLASLSYGDTYGRAAVLDRVPDAVDDDRYTARRAAVLYGALEAAEAETPAAVAYMAGRAAYKAIDLHLSSIRAIRDDGRDVVPFDDIDADAEAMRVSHTEYEARRREYIRAAVAVVLPTLTDAQKRVLAALYRTRGGCTEAARIVGRTRETVKSHRAAIAAKMADALAARGDTIEARDFGFIAEATKAEAETARKEAAARRTYRGEAAKAARAEAETARRKLALLTVAPAIVRETPATVAEAATVGREYTAYKTAKDAEAVALSECRAYGPRVNAAYADMTAKEAEAAKYHTAEAIEAAGIARRVYSHLISKAPATVAAYRDAAAKAEAAKAAAIEADAAERRDRPAKAEAATEAAKTTKEAEAARAIKAEAARAVIAARRAEVKEAKEAATKAAEALTAKEAEAARKEAAEAKEAATKAAARLAKVRDRYAAREEAAEAAKEAEAVAAVVAAVVAAMPPSMREAARDAAKGLSLREAAAKTGRDYSAIGRTRRRAAARIAAALEAAKDAAKTAKEAAALATAAKAAKAAPESVLMLIG